MKEIFKNGFSDIFFRSKFNYKLLISIALQYLFERVRYLYFYQETKTKVSFQKKTFIVYVKINYIFTLRRTEH